MPRSDYVSTVRRIVVKIGSSSISDAHGISREKVANFADQISRLSEQGYELVIVTSGAISAGVAECKKKRDSLSVPQKQALAAVGQSVLMDVYREAFSRYSLKIGQLLLTEDDVKNRRRFLNIRNTMNMLLHMNIVPVVNENDTVVVTEIRFGDNDTLSAHVAQLVEADLLVLLSDINGFYYDLSDSEPADIITHIDENIRACAGDAGSTHGTGGMITKLRAAEMMLRSGEMMVIANASDTDVLPRILRGEKVGTLFAPRDYSHLNGKKKWILFHAKAVGAVVVDEGARNALVQKNSSLLPIGIVNVSGHFKPGDTVDIIYDNIPVARGIINFSSEDIIRIKGKHSDVIQDLLGEEFYDEAIHRDNLTLLVST